MTAAPFAECRELMNHFAARWPSYSRNVEWGVVPSSLNTHTANYQPQHECSRRQNGHKSCMKFAVNTTKRTALPPAPDFFYALRLVLEVDQYGIQILNGCFRANVVSTRRTANAICSSVCFFPFMLTSGDGPRHDVRPSILIWTRFRGAGQLDQHASRCPTLACRSTNITSPDLLSGR